MKGPNKARFEVIFSEGRSVKGKFARLLAIPGTGLLGIATSKKIGSRPLRNRAKRRFAEAVRLGTRSLAKSLDYVLIVQANASNASFDRIQEEVGTLFGQMMERWASELESS